MLTKINSAFLSQCISTWQAPVSSALQRLTSSLSATSGTSILRPWQPATSRICLLHVAISSLRCLTLSFNCSLLASDSKAIIPLSDSIYTNSALMAATSAPNKSYKEDQQWDAIDAHSHLLECLLSWEAQLTTSGIIAGTISEKVVGSGKTAFAGSLVESLFPKHTDLFNISSGQIDEALASSLCFSLCAIYEQVSLLLCALLPQVAQTSKTGIVKESDVSRECSDCHQHQLNPELLTFQRPVESKPARNAQPPKVSPFDLRPRLLAAGLYSELPELKRGSELFRTSRYYEKPHGLRAIATRLASYLETMVSFNFYVILSIHVLLILSLNIIMVTLLLDQ
ncbi:unnamed protein product [Protopolystoma xenopodis]|uniref:Uncharacterized protein n=1 Tax=Protopolystoma xenopodis TaxID=117903 RepID=A0A3S5A7P5_9PLAT|nr:unnamed protein product [Protopolystoma xenopodis]